MYELERISNPFGHSTQPWLVIRGTGIGASETFLQSLNESAYGEFKVERVGGPRVT